MRNYVNGKYIEMTTQEITTMQDEAKKAEIQEKFRPLTAEEVSAMLIRQQINTLTVDDQTALRMVAYYPEWTAGTAYAAGDRLVSHGDL